MAATPCDVRWQRIAALIGSPVRCQQPEDFCHGDGDAHWRPIWTGRYLSGGRGAAGTGAYAHRAIIKRFCMRALTVLIVGGIVAGIIALKVAFVLSRLNY